MQKQNKQEQIETKRKLTNKVYCEWCGAEPGEPCDIQTSGRDSSTYKGDLFKPEALHLCRLENITPEYIANHLTTHGKKIYLYPSSAEDNDDWGNDNHKNAFKNLIETLLSQTGQDIAQECYLQCLAVHCGDNECSDAINEKFNLGNK